MKIRKGILVGMLLSVVPFSARGANLSSVPLAITAQNFSQDRPARLMELHNLFFDSAKDQTYLRKEIDNLIGEYKLYLKQMEEEPRRRPVEKNIHQEIHLLLGSLDKGKDNFLGEKGQAIYCLELISLIESLFEKLETPENEEVEKDLPLPSLAIEDSFKRLKGEQLPYVLTRKLSSSALEENKQLGSNDQNEDSLDMPLPPPLSYVKTSSLLPEDDIAILTSNNQ